MDKLCLIIPRPFYCLTVFFVIMICGVATAQEVNTVQISARIVTEGGRSQGENPRINIIVENLGKTPIFNVYPMAKVGNQALTGRKTDLKPSESTNWALTDGLPSEPGRIPILAEIKYHDISGLGASTIALGEIRNGSIDKRLPVIITTEVQNVEGNSAEFTIDNTSSEPLVVKLNAFAPSALLAKSDLSSVNLKPFGSSRISVSLSPPPFKGSFPLALIAVWDSNKSVNFSHAVISISPKGGSKRLFFFGLFASSLIALTVIRVGASYYPEFIAAVCGVLKDD